MRCTGTVRHIWILARGKGDGEYYEIGMHSCTLTHGRGTGLGGQLRGEVADDANRKMRWEGGNALKCSYKRFHPRAGSTVSRVKGSDLRIRV